MTESHDAPILSLEHVSKTFHSGKGTLIHAVRDVSLVINPREIVCLVGESGSGKSTTANLIMGTETPTQGVVSYRGQNLAQIRTRSAILDYRRHVQMIFQDPYGSLNSLHTVGYTVGRPMQIHHLVPSINRGADQILRLLRQVGLTPPSEYYYKLPYQLSGGQRQRVAIARALAVQPDLVVADEPVSMLDVSLRAGILQLILEARESAGVAFLYITHDLASARYIGDRILVMYKGRLCEEGPAEEVIAHPHHPYTQALVEAVPNPERMGQPEEIIVTPDLNETKVLGSGCPYYPLCPVATAQCQDTMPEWTFVQDQHQVRCFNAAPLSMHHTS
ncbi:MAG: ABC transporter ATP-binding protein [Sulfobacillus acidophilus]|uniref:ABC transporter ATP-binding protein n=1 Tax=Sulfobacillus acidophilus TaxID=53633 RepID=A0A2T2WJL6_9FIRM|nr:MAG: ABC transporter ATP-binding protein [Sulfobacillus acidophilus]